MSLKRKALPDETVKFQTSASVILLDIEGTTTSISFVKDELFPYVTKNVKSYLESHYDDEETQQDITALRDQVELDKKTSVEGVVEIAASGFDKEKVISTTVANVNWQMSSDRKTTALKQLQGHMWKSAYETGEVKGHVYADVKECFKRWTTAGKTICIYSSGSVAAQKLLFFYSVSGDLTKYLTDYFDTNTGGKRESSSYTKIADHINVDPKQILFLTDIKEEADAAKAAGMATGILVRDGGDVSSDTDDHPRLTTFEQIVLIDDYKPDEDDAVTGAKVSKLSDSTEANGAGGDTNKVQ